MTYEKYKTGTFRVCVILTIVVWAIVIGTFGPSRPIGIWEHLKYVREPVFWFTVLIWGPYYASLWIVKGYIGKK